MPKATISFNLPEEQEDLETAMSAPKMSAALSEIRDKVFRPARKHGYAHEDLNDLTPREVEIISKLEGIFNDILIDYDLSD